MATKICTLCKEDKPLSEFTIKRNGKYHSWCNLCRLNYNKEWKEKRADHVKDYKERTKEERKIKEAKYREENRDKLREVSKIYNELCREKRKQQRLLPKIRQREKERGIKWRSENKEHLARYFREYYEKHPEKKAIRNLSHRLYKLLVGDIKALHSKDLVGCDLVFFKQHIESQFTEGMSWSNYGIWHVDHKIPCNAFDFRNPLHQRACFYWINLQPMWGAENISKNDNYSPVEFNTYMIWFTNNIISKEK